ncbi:germin-like protein 9-3 [Argentina anserina]|uniref:germin-like protein 9-3 n=1 Tax=Argentina anserina TaxID=57926 RepID=UPI00217627BB|nr:germin-like protein 9-3 [Potentilla anserina]
MASTLKLISLLILSSAIIQMAMADPDIISDFIKPTPNATVDANYFTFTGMRGLVGTTPATFSVSKATSAEFPAIFGQSVSYAVLRFPSGTVNPLHTHPRSAELLFLVNGTLEVGFVDTKNNLFTQTMQTGDLFVFPKGLVHYQYNADAQNPALAISAFGSASAGTVSIPSTLFTTNIDDNVLALSLKTDVATVEKLKAGLTQKP